MGNVFSKSYTTKKVDVQIMPGEWLELKQDIPQELKLELITKTEGGNFIGHVTETLEFLLQHGVVDWSFEDREMNKVPLTSEGFNTLPVTLGRYVIALLFKWFLNSDLSYGLEVSRLPDVTSSTASMVEAVKQRVEAVKKKEKSPNQEVTNTTAS